MYKIWADNREHSFVVYNALKKQEKRDKITSHNTSGDMPWHLLVSAEGRERVLIDADSDPGLIEYLTEWYSNVDVINWGIEKTDTILQLAGSQRFINVNTVLSEKSHNLPFSDNSFDVVYISNHSAINNKQLISDINRILKIGGSVYFQIENKYSAKNIVGLFRPSSDTTGIKKGGNIRKFMRLLEKSGFKKIKTFLFSPAYIEPSNIELIDIKRTLDSKPIQKNLISSLKNRLRNSDLYRKYLASHYSICAVKDSGRNYIDLIIEQISQETGNVPYEISGSSIMITKKGAFVFKLSSRDNNRSGIVKVALNKYANKQLADNYQQIEEIHKNSSISPKLKKIIPRPLCKSSCNGYEYYFEELKDGVAAVHFSDNPLIMDSALSNAADCITSLHKETRHQNEKNKVEVLNELENKIALMDAATDFAFEQYFIGLAKTITRALKDVELPMVFHKGDCSTHNLLVSDDYKVSAIIDWDQSSSSSLPLIDIINLFESFRRHTQKLGMGKVFSDYLLPKRLTQLEREILSKYCTEIGISEDLFTPMCFVYWIEHVSAQIHVHNPEWINSNISLVVKKLLKNIDIKNYFEVAG